MTYISWRLWLLCEWKLSFEIGGLRCVEYIEKKPNFPILTNLKSQIFFINPSTMVANIQPSYKKVSGPKLMILWLYKKLLKWGQCLSVLKTGSYWSELTELFPGRWSPKYLHTRLMVEPFLCRWGSYKITVVSQSISSAFMSRWLLVFLTWW